MNEIKLDDQADHEFDMHTESGTACVLIPHQQGELSVEFYFEVNTQQYVTLLSVGDAYQEINGISEDYIYTLQPEHEASIKEVIENYISPLYDSEQDFNNDYDRYNDHGMTNSDFLYGF